MPSPRLLQTIVLFPLLLAACTLESAGDEDCYRGKCDEGDDVRSQLDGLSEPIADWLRASPMDRDGILETGLPLGHEAPRAVLRLPAWTRSRRSSSTTTSSSARRFRA